MSKSILALLMGIPLFVVWFIWLTWAAWGDRFLRWLKGLSESYGLDQSSGELKIISRPLRRDVQRKDCGLQSTVIEVRRILLFQNWAKIFGEGAEHWKIARVSGPAGRDLHLIDLDGLGISAALRTVNMGKPLEGLLDRIDELEHQVKHLQKVEDHADERRQESLAAIFALRRIIQNDKQRYRSPAAQNIASYIELVISKAQEMREPNPSEAQILDWMRFHTESRT